MDDSEAAENEELNSASISYNGQSYSGLYKWADAQYNTVYQQVLENYNAAIKAVYDLIDDISDVIVNRISTTGTTKDLLQLTDKMLSDISVWNVNHYTAAAFSSDADFMPSILYEKEARSFSGTTRDTYTATADQTRQSGKTYYTREQYQPTYGDTEIGMSVMNVLSRYYKIATPSFYKQKDQIDSLQQMADSLAEDFGSLSAAGFTASNAKLTADNLYPILSDYLHGKTSAISASEGREIFYRYYAGY